MPAEEQDINIDEIINVFKNRWKLILFPGIIAAFIVAALTFVVPRTYESYALIKIGSVGASPIETVASIIDIMQAYPTRQLIAEKLGEKNNEKFIKAIKNSIEYSDESGLAKIKSVATTP